MLCSPCLFYLLQRKLCHDGFFVTVELVLGVTNVLLLASCHYLGTPWGTFLFQRKTFPVTITAIFFWGVASAPIFSSLSLMKLKF